MCHLFAASKFYIKRRTACLAPKFSFFNWYSLQIIFGLMCVFMTGLKSPKISEKFKRNQLCNDARFIAVQCEKVA